LANNNNNNNNNINNNSFGHYVDTNVHLMVRLISNFDSIDYFV